MSIQKYVPQKQDVIRIKVIELPETFASGEGLYEWRYLYDKHYMDIVTLKRELLDVAPKHKVLPPDRVAEQILDMLQNFRRVFINTVTGELST